MVRIKNHIWNGTTKKDRMGLKLKPNMYHEKGKVFAATVNRGK
jgi:hypothetical protein